MPIYLTFIYASIAIFSLTLGILALIKNYRSNVNSTFFLFTLSQALWIIVLYFGYFFIFHLLPIPEKSIFFLRLAYGFGFLMYPILTIFFYYFPRVTFKISRIWKIFFIFSSFTVAIVASSTSLVHKQQILNDGVYIGDIFGSLYLPYTLIFIINLLLAGYMATKKVSGLKGLERKKVMVATIGCWSFLLVTSMTNVILPFLGIYKIGSFYFTTHSPLYTLLFLIPAFYSIRKHRFFHFSNTSLNFLRKVTLYATFFLSFFLIYRFFNYVFPNFNLILANVIGALISLLILDKLQKVIPELVSESFRELRNALIEFGSEIYSCETYIKLQTAIEKIFLVQLNMVNAKVFILREKKTKLDIPVYIKDKFTNELKGYQKDVLIADEIPFKKTNEKTKKTILSTMEKLEADLCMPLFSEKNLIGFFVLKKKTGESHYSTEEINEILKIKRDLEIGLMNILLKMNLQEENNLMKAIIDKKTKALRKQFKEIKELLRQQSDFIAVTAHEFRTPLNIAMFQLGDILDSGKDKKPATLTKDLKVVDSSLDDLKNLMQKLFEVQQYDLNKVEINKEKTEIKEFTKNIYNNFTLLMKEKSLSFSLNDNLKKKTYINIGRLAS